MAADRGAFIDQSASLNLFMESPNIGAMSSMYMHAWKRGIKTTYYLRSRPATTIAKATVGSEQAMAPKQEYAPDEALACSLEHPESCEDCRRRALDVHAQPFSIFPEKVPEGRPKAFFQKPQPPPPP